MLFSGQLRFPKQTSSLSTSLLKTAIEYRAHILKQNQNQIIMLVPGAESVILEQLKRAPVLSQLSHSESSFQRFWDRLIFKFNPDGTVTYTLDYWTASQLFIHGLINLVILLEFLLIPQEVRPVQGFVILLLGNLLPIMASHISSSLFILAIFWTTSKKLRTQNS